MADSYLHEKHFDERTRTHQVLLGVATAAIGFAFHETSDRNVAWPLTLTLGAVFAWGGSFACGILHSHKIGQAIAANIAIGLAATDEQRTRSREVFTKYNAGAQWTYSAQQWLLLAGALLYLGGHIWHLADLRKEAPMSNDKHIKTDVPRNIPRPIGQPGERHPDDKVPPAPPPLKK